MSYTSGNTILGVIIDIIGAFIRYMISRFKGDDLSFKEVFNAKNEEEKLKNEVINRVVAVVVFISIIAYIFSGLK